MIAFYRTKSLMMALIGLVAFALQAEPASVSPVPDPVVEQWGTHEISLPGPASGNPFVDVQFSAVFTNGSRKIEVAGFYDGEGIYRVRFMPEFPGRWTYQTQSNCWELTGKSGEFQVRPAGKGNHGPVRVFNTYHFAYADGTPYRQVGTTIYNWIDAPEEVQEQTLRTLAASPFNKARMLLTQQPTPYRNNFAPPRWPFEGQPPRAWDFSRFNPAFFRHYEKRIVQLRELGIEADLILFNPYGKFGFETLGAAGDESFVRYVVARFGAYRNIWWSLANEYDFLRTKTEADWDRLGRLLQQCDPFDHLRSIHNAHLAYDNRKAWVTHSSVQNGNAVETPSGALVYRDVWRKPVVFDEVKYEGDGKFRWADLTGFDMVHRFWTGLVAGTYVGHGDYFNTHDEDTWTSFGGAVLGTSMPRLAFLRRIMEEGPAEGLEPTDSGHDVNTAGVNGEYYLTYFGRSAPTAWTFTLPKRKLEDGMKFVVDVIDVWEMTIVRVPGEFVVRKKDRYTFTDAQGRSVVLPGKAGMALRIRRVGTGAAAAEAEVPVEQN